MTLVLYKLKKKQLKNSIYLIEQCRRPAKYLRHFAFTRVFFRSESEFKTSATSGTEPFVTLANA